MPEQTTPAQNQVKQPKPAPAAKADDGLVEVRKADERLHVHPTTVAAHVSAGWRVAADERA